MPRRRNIEGPITTVIVNYLRLVLPPQSVVTHVRNEIDIRGKDAARAIAKARDMGMLPGFVDVVAAMPGPVTVFIEVKAKGEALQPTQKAVRDDLLALGHHYLLARSVDDVREFWRLHGLPSREMVG